MDRVVPRQCDAGDAVAVQPQAVRRDGRGAQADAVDRQYGAVAEVDGERGGAELIGGLRQVLVARQQAVDGVAQGGFEARFPDDGGGGSSAARMRGVILASNSTA
jgi:hypothetical protein